MPSPRLHLALAGVLAPGLGRSACDSRNVRDFTDLGDSPSCIDMPTEVALDEALPDGFTAQQVLDLAEGEMEEDRSLEAAIPTASVRAG